MRLFFYEFRKTFLRLYVVILLIVLSVLNLVKIGMDYYKGTIDVLVVHTSEEKEAFKQLYTKIKGPFTEESYEFLRNEEKRLGEIYERKLNQYNKEEWTYSGNLYLDYRILEKFIAYEYYYMRDYQDNCAQVVAAAKENIPYYQDKGNLLKVRESEFVVENYSNRSISQFYRTAIIDQYIEYNFSSVLVLFLCFLGVAPVFGTEYECKMNEILSVSKRGKMYSIFAKILAALCFTALIVLWFSLLDFLAYHVLFTFEGLDNPIWAVEEFEDSFLNCTIANFIIHQSFLKLLAFEEITLVLLLFSLLVRRVIYVAVSFVVLMIYWYVTSSWIDSFKMWEVLISLWNPICLMRPYKLYQTFQYIEFGNHFVLKSAMCIWGNVGMMGFWVAFILMIRQGKCYLGVLSFFICVLVFGIFSGIHTKKNSEEFYKNSAFQPIGAITDKYHLEMELANQIICENLETRESFKILRDPFEQESDEFTVTFFATNEYLYYAKNYQFVTRNYDEHFEIRIYCVDLRNFSEKCIYSKSYSLEEEKYYQFNLQLVSKDYFFILSTENGTSKNYAVNRKTGKWELISEAQTILYVGEYGNKIYYQNYENHIAAYDLRKREMVVYDEINLRNYRSMRKNSEYCIYEDYCYYTNILDHDYLYRYNFKTNENQLIVSDQVVQWGLYASEPYLYYKNSEHNVYRINTYTMESKKLAKNVEGNILLSVDGSILFRKFTDKAGASHWEKIN